MSVLRFSTSLDHGQMDPDCILDAEEIGCFSLNQKRQFCHDRSEMTYLADHMPMGRVQNTIDLNNGFEDRYIESDEKARTGLYDLLRWILVNKDQWNLPDSTPQTCGENKIGDFPDFFVCRGYLTKIMCSPFERRNGWKMACQKLHNIIYISEVKADDASNSYPGEKRMTFWGRRFEYYMVRRSHPSDEAIPTVDQDSIVVNDKERFKSVLRGTLNQHHSLVYGAEVDCCQPEGLHNPPECYVELKTNRIFTEPRQKENFHRFKALKWWAQSYLSGTPQIICGFRDDDGFVTSIERFSTSKLPNNALPLRNSWNPVTCLNFLDVVLSDIKKLYQQDKSLEGSVLFLTRSPGDNKVTHGVSEDPEDKFLPDWYLDEMSSLMT